MITWIRALLAAHRLQLRDRGKVQGEWFAGDDEYVGYYRTWVHSPCNTRLRIGIKNGQAVRWCWRCEQIVRPSSGGSSPPGAEKDYDDSEVGKVIPLFGGQIGS